jgi:hypothetical protein
MIEGHARGLDYDTLRDEAPDEIAALEDWIARMHHAALPPSPLHGRTARREPAAALKR